MRASFSSPALIAKNPREVAIAGVSESRIALSMDATAFFSRPAPMAWIASTTADTGISGATRVWRSSSEMVADLGQFLRSLRIDHPRQRLQGASGRRLTGLLLELFDDRLALLGAEFEQHRPRQEHVRHQELGIERARRFVALDGPAIACAFEHGAGGELVVGVLAGVFVVLGQRCGRSREIALDQVRGELPEHHLGLGHLEGACAMHGGVDAASLAGQDQGTEHAIL